MIDNTSENLKNLSLNKIAFVSRIPRPPKTKPDSSVYFSRLQKNNELSSLNVHGANDGSASVKDYVTTSQGSLWLAKPTMHRNGSGSAVSRHQF